MKRFFLILIAICVSVLACPLALGQTKFFNSVRPQASIVVKKHAMGADLVEVTVLGGNNLPEDLKAKIDVLGQYLGNPARGVQLLPSPEYLKATFAINGIMNTAEPFLDLPALAKSFAFGTKPITSFSVFFDGLAPTPNIPARWFAPEDAWMLEGVAMANPKGIEFRVQVNTKDAKKISLPGSKSAETGDSKASEKSSTDFVLIGALIVGAIAVGLLVYSALIRPRQRKV